MNNIKPKPSNAAGSEFILHGDAPYRVVLIHGGPGAPGELELLARELATDCGVLEHLQRGSSIDELLSELKSVLNNNADPPVVLVGYSWGAMLGYIFTAKNPSMVKKLILVGSAVFDDRYAVDINKTRLSRMSDVERIEAQTLMDELVDSDVKDKDKVFTRLGGYIAKADAYDPLPNEEVQIDCQFDIYNKVWTEARELRASGELLAMGNDIRCPVVAIHGDYDPHPIEGVSVSLQKVVADFKFILLKNCGHKPWQERLARDEFFKVLNAQLNE